MFPVLPDWRSNAPVSCSQAHEVFSYRYVQFVMSINLYNAHHCGSVLLKVLHVDPLRSPHPC